MKTCSKCLSRKPLNAFYKQSDRYESQCKACKKASRQKRKIKSMALEDENSKFSDDEVQIFAEFFKVFIKIDLK